jgi:hypothetical protein
MILQRMGSAGLALVLLAFLRLGRLPAFASAGPVASNRPGEATDRELPAGQTNRHAPATIATLGGKSEATGSGDELEGKGSLRNSHGWTRGRGRVLPTALKHASTTKGPRCRRLLQPVS